MSSRGGIVALTNEQSKSAKKPVFTEIVKESLKSIILSGESDLNGFVSHHILYLFGYLTGWNPRIFSLEILPICYFLIWTIVLFTLNEITFALLFLISGTLIFIYFILLHSVISSWDRIKHWFINRARKRGGIKNMTLEDIKYLLIFTRKVFGVKSTLDETKIKEYDPYRMRLLLLRNKRWQHTLTLLVILTVLAITGAGIYGVVINEDIINILSDWWYLFLISILPILVGIIGTIISKYKIRENINTIPQENFEDVLQILNEFEVFGGKK